MKYIQYITCNITQGSSDVLLIQDEVPEHTLKIGSRFLNPQWTQLNGLRLASNNLNPDRNSAKPGSGTIGYPLGTIWVPSRYHLVTIGTGLSKERKSK